MVLGKTWAFHSVAAAFCGVSFSEWFSERQTCYVLKENVQKWNYEYTTLTGIAIWRVIDLNIVKRKRTKFFCTFSRTIVSLSTEIDSE